MTVYSLHLFSVEIWTLQGAHTVTTAFLDLVSAPLHYSFWQNSSDCVIITGWYSSHPNGLEVQMGWQTWGCLYCFQNKCRWEEGTLVCALLEMCMKVGPVKGEDACRWLNLNSQCLGHTNRTREADFEDTYMVAKPIIKIANRKFGSTK